MDAATTSVTEQPILDPGAIERLQEWGGPPLVQKMIRLFLDNTGEKMAHIQAGIADRSFDKAVRGAHSLKSSAGNLGAQRLSRLAAMIESSSESGDIEVLMSLLPKIVVAYELTCAELETVAGRLAE